MAPGSVVFRFAELRALEMKRYARNDVINSTTGSLATHLFRLCWS